MDDTTQGTLASLLAGRCWRPKKEWPKAIAAFMRGVNMPNASDAELSELFYDLGDTYTQLPDAKEALLFFQLAQGTGRLSRRQSALPGWKSCTAPTGACCSNQRMNKNK